MAADELVARWRALLPGFDATQHLLGPLAAAGSRRPTRSGCECNVRGYHRLGGAAWMVAGRYESGVADPGATRGSPRSRCTGATRRATALLVERATERAAQHTRTDP